VKERHGHGLTAEDKKKKREKKQKNERHGLREKTRKEERKKKKKEEGKWPRIARVQHKSTGQQVKIRPWVPRRNVWVQKKQKNRNWAWAQLIWTPKAQLLFTPIKVQLSKPNSYWAPEESKAQLKWAPATSKYISNS
jgi:hypothetical protein